MLAVFASIDWSVAFPRFVGEIALLTVGAVMLGFLVEKALPKPMNPKLFAVLLPFTALGVLAYVGSYSAAAALVLFAALAVVMLALGIS